MASSKLNKKLWTEITKLKLLIKPDAPVRFLLDYSPFDEIDDKKEEEETTAAVNPKDPVIIGRILPMSDIYREGHFCPGLLERSLRWAHATCLADAIKDVVHYIDTPDIDYSISVELAREYMENKSTFDRKAMDYVKRYALHRF